MPGDYVEFWAQNMLNILILTFGDLPFFSGAMDLKSAFVSFLITFPPTRITCHIYTFEIQNSGDFSKLWEQFEIQGPLTFHIRVHGFTTHLVHYFVMKHELLQTRSAWFAELSAQKKEKTKIVE